MRTISLSIIACFALFVGMQCAKDSEQSSTIGGRDDMLEQVKLPSTSRAQLPAAEDQGKASSEAEGGFFTSARLKSMLILPMEKSKERLLEYHVSLSYQCSDFHKARAELINIISQYGFVKSGNTDVRHTSHLYVNAAIQAKDIYRFLLDMDRVGTLVTENIRVNDLTEEMVISMRRIKREDIRIERKQKALAGMSAQAKNWQAIEQSISQSEDNYDQSEHNKWKVMDRVSWANVSISLEPYGAVHVPPYKKALLEIIDLVLWIPYALIYLTPIILLALLVRWKWQWVKSFFGKKESNSAQ